ncbi:MAG TPA: LysE family transporter [Xanthomonadales bacterium]|nr:LysE family transporter [Xanthomonadales bacterium]
MSFATWLLYLVTDVALALTPGPAVLFVVATGLRHGLRPALGANLGILAANTVYFVASALGLGVLLASAEPVFVALKWLGAAYLVWLGIASLRAAAHAGRRGAGEPPAALAAGAKLPAATPGGDAFATAFRAALLLQLGNPKAILFFTALLPQFVSPESSLPVAAQVAILGATGNAAEFLVLAGYGLLASRAARMSDDPRLLATFERASGVCLLGCAALALAA